MRKKKAKGDILFELSVMTTIVAFVWTNSVEVASIVFIFTIALIIGIKEYKKSILKKKYLNSGIGIVDKFQGEEFEKFLLAHFLQLGYSGKTTSKTNDYGADLVLQKDRDKVVVQAKRWTSKVGIGAIQEGIGAREYYRADKCIVVTNNYFTKNAEELAKSSNVELWNRDKLIKVMNGANGRNIINNNNFNVREIEERRICKKCGSKLVVRTGNSGDFYGCSKFPKCRYTESTF